MTGAAILLAARADGAQAAALLSGGRLEDLLLTSPDADGWGAEALARGRVARLLRGAEGGKGAAFLSFGPGAAQGYLGEPGHLREGDRVLAEIRTFPSGGKAWPMTRRVALRSRRLALTPGAPGLNISRAVKDGDARAAIGAALESALGAEEGIGCVARSVCDADREGLEEEAVWLLNRWRKAEAEGEGLRVAEPGAVALALRDWSGRGRRAPPRILVQSGADAAHGGAIALALSDAAAPSDPIHSRLEAAGEDLFDRLDVWSQAATALNSRHALPSGGALHLEATAALTAADVDSGEGSAAAADAEAARLLPRLLRIGGHGGLIAADFLARGAAPRKAVEQILAKALSEDPVETETLGWTRGGLLELRRKRARLRLTSEAMADWVGG